MAKSTYLKDLMKTKNQENTIDVDNELRDIVEEARTESPATNYENVILERNSLQSRHMNHMDHQQQVDELTNKLQQQLLQQKILQEQLIQQQQPHKSMVSNITSYMFTTVFLEMNFIFAIVILYVLFKKTDMISFLKFDKISIIESTPIIKTVVESLVFTVCVVLLKNNV